MAGEEEEEESSFLIDSARLGLDGTTEEEEEEEEGKDKVVTKSFSSHSKEVDTVLKSAGAVQAIAIDLSKKGLVRVPDELYGMDHVEVMRFKMDF